MDLAFLKDALATLFVVIDPPGLLPIFLTLTASMSEAARRKIANKSVIIAWCILAASTLAGAPLLEVLGISIPAFRIAGGLMLFYIAWEMIFSKREQRKASTAEASIEHDHSSNIAVFPLAIPMIAGPGAMTATILLASKTGGDPVNYAIMLAVLAVVVACCWLVFRLSGPIDKLMGFTGRVILERLLGVLLAALAVQIIGDGIVAFV